MVSRNTGWSLSPTILRLKGFAMPSFDVVSKVDMQEVRNAIDQASRELVNRYDFKVGVLD